MAVSPREDRLGWRIAMILVEAIGGALALGVFGYCLMQVG